MNTKLALTLAALGCLTPVHGALLFYESFNSYSDGDLNSQGGWVSSTAQVVSSTFDGWNGTSPAQPTSGGSFLASTNQDLFHIALGSSVTSTFTAGTSTWFSYVQYNGSNGSPGRHAAAIGAAEVTGSYSGTVDLTGSGSWGGAEMVGEGIGLIASSDNQGDAASWTPNPTGFDFTASTGTNVGAGRPNLYVARIDWASGGNNDVITAVRFDQNSGVPTLTDWNNGAQTTFGADLDQSTFDTLSFFNNNVTYMDDIRIASDFTSVISGTVVIPEPSTALLGGLGLLALLRRRRN